MKRVVLVAGLLFALSAPPADAAPRTRDFTLGPITVGPYQVRYDNLLAPKPPGNGYVTHMEVNVVDGPGADAKPVPINRLMLHHIVFANLAKRDTSCGAFTSFDNAFRLPPFERIYGAGEERAKLVLPPGYGYRFAAGEAWGLTYMFMNHRNRTDRAWIRYRITYDTEPLTAVRPYWLDVRNCRADPVFDVPGGRKRGSTFTRSATWTAPEAGRIVAGGGHVHGGAKSLLLRRRDCDGPGRLYRSRPLWGNADHPFYKVRPVLHEPGPISMSGFLSSKGIPVAKGERLRLNANYDGELPHTRVMGIMMVYLAPDSSVRERCGGRPDDLADFRSNAPGRKRTPRFKVPIVGLRDGVARKIRKPPGKRRRAGRRARVKVGDQFFRRANLSVARGALVRWRFTGDDLHNVTVANGPRGFSSRNLTTGKSYRKRLRRPGTYQLFCALHPVAMTATIKVRK